MKQAFDLKKFLLDPSKSFTMGIQPEKKKSKNQLLALPLEKRIGFLLTNNRFLSVFKITAQDVLARARKKKSEVLSRLKRQSPETFQDIDESFTELVDDEISHEMRRTADTFMRTCFTEEEMMDVSNRLFDPHQKFTQTDLGMMKIGILIRQHELEGLEKCFGPKNGVFQALLFRDATELTNFIGSALKDDPRSILRYGLLSLLGFKGMDKQLIANRADTWTANWLDRDRLKLLLSADTLKPNLSSKKGVSEKYEQEKIRRYQNDFKVALLYYLAKSPAEATAVFDKVLPFLERAESDIQQEIWRLMFNKLEKCSDIQPKIVSHISRFLENAPSSKGLKAFYSSFIKFVSPKIRSEIIGAFNAKTLKRYRNAFQQNQSFIHTKIKVGDREEYLLWHLFSKGEMTDKEMTSLLKELDLKKHKDFIFSNKTFMDKDLFSNMATHFMTSNYYFWRWVKSFQNVPNFAKRLAEIYPTLHPKIKDNALYTVAFNRHFDLVRQCALNGDTSSLSFLKNQLRKDIFWADLTKSKADEISGVSALCQQGKRGLLKLLSSLPLSEQQHLLQNPDTKGKSPVDFCVGSFLRMVEENIFQRQYIKKPSMPISEEAPQAPLKAPDPLPSLNTGKSAYPRQVVRLANFESNMARLKTNPRLQQEVENILEDLATMSGSRIQAELREGWKKNERLEKLAVKDIRGDRYRLGYIVQGDADKNQGKIAFLFLWTHAQYNTSLNKQGKQLVSQALSLLDSAHPIPSVPVLPNSGNGGR